jgi:hypothetical protein
MVLHAVHEKERGHQVGVAARVWVNGGRHPAPSYIEGGVARAAPSPSLVGRPKWAREKIFPQVIISSYNCLIPSLLLTYFFQ